MSTSVFLTYLSLVGWESCASHGTDEQDARERNDGEEHDDGMLKMMLDVSQTWSCG